MQNRGELQVNYSNPISRLLLLLVCHFSLVITASVELKAQCLSGDCNSGNGKFRNDAKFNTYEGAFKNGKYEGDGKLTWDSKAAYEGAFVGGNMEGNGKYSLSNGNSYTGGFSLGTPDGKGVFVYADGVRQEGVFSKGAYFLEGSGEGQGKMLWAWNGNIYEGNFHNGKLEGHGKMILHDGAYYEGEWKNGRQIGVQIYKPVKGGSFSYTYVDGKIEGPYQLTYADGSVEVGSIRNGWHDGVIIKKLQDGSLKSFKLVEPEIPLEFEFMSERYVEIKSSIQSNNPLSAISFYDGQLQFGYRMLDSKTDLRIISQGISVNPKDKIPLSKVVNGKFTQITFDFKSSRCFLGDCRDGFGSEFKISGDTAAYLYTGNFEAGKWAGEGSFYDYKRGTFFAGVFQNGGPQTGGYLNEEQMLAKFIKNGTLIKALPFQYPAGYSFEFREPNQQPKQETVASQKKEKKSGGFWKALGEVALGVAIVGTAVLEEEAKADAAKKKQQQSVTSSGSGSVKCRYYVEWWTEEDDTKIIIEGVGTIAESTANYVKSNSPKGTTKWFDSYQAAANFKQEKANVAISQGYEIAYKTAPTFEKNCINK